MASPITRSTSRFQRRILGLGALATLLLVIIGAPFFVNHVEGDLEQRVPTELAAAGFPGVAASFSGQDGTLRCAAPLDDPEGAIAAAYDVWGVRAIEVDRSCRVNRAPLVETTTTVEGDELTEASAVFVTGTEQDVADTAQAPTATSIPPDFDTVADIVATSPQLSLLAVLIAEAGLSEVLGSETSAPVTLFAPTDEAFDALPADEFAKLRSDPELLMKVLSHHAVAGDIRIADLVNGELVTMDGGTVDIARSGTEVSVSGAMVIAADLTARNGVVHVVDAVLPPDLSVVGRFAETSAVFESGEVTLSGVVATEVERAALIDAARGVPETVPVIDLLTVDPDRGLDAAATASLARLVAAVPVNLVQGVSGFDGNEFYVRGTYLTEADRDAMATVAEAVGAAADLQPPPVATDTDAADVEQQLNAFVAARPVQFEPSSSVLTDSSTDVIDRLAQIVQQFSGIAITVEGHTDSDGSAAENVLLSRFRALVVRQALIDRGIPAGVITAEGFGSERPILVDGTEDKVASRRVEFRVVVVA